MNVIFNYVFLSMFGLIGSAYGTLLSYCVVFILNQIILYRMYNINTLKVFEGIFEWYRVGWSIITTKLKSYSMTRLELERLWFVGKVFVTVTSLYSVYRVGTHFIHRLHFRWQNNSR
jgi:Na+-driven multidrug efflux pump